MRTEMFGRTMRTMTTPVDRKDQKAVGQGAGEGLLSDLRVKQTLT